MCPRANRSDAPIPGLTENWQNTLCKDVLGKFQACVVPARDAPEPRRRENQLTATCRSCGRLADSEAYFCASCGGDIAIKTESRNEVAADRTLKQTAFFAPDAPTANVANSRSEATPPPTDLASVPVELAMTQVIAGLVGLYFILTNLRFLPQNLSYLFEFPTFGGLSLTARLLLLVVGGAFLYSILLLKNGEMIGRLVLLTLAAATVVSLIRSSWGPFSSLTPAQVLVMLGCLALAGLLAFSPKLKVLTGSGEAVAGEVPDSVWATRTLLLAFAGLSAMMALGLLPMIGEGWQQPVLGLVILGAAGMTASLGQSMVLGDPSTRMKLSVAVAACYAATWFSSISPTSATYLFVAGAAALTVLWLGNASRGFFGDALIAYPAWTGGPVDFQRAAEGGMRAINQLGSSRPATVEPQVPLRLAVVGPVADGQKRECPSLEIAIANRTFLPYSWDLEPPRDGYVVTAQLKAPPALDLNGFEEQTEQSFRGTSTLTFDSSSLLGVGVRGKSHVGEVDPKGRVVAWALPYQTVSGVRLVVDQEDQDIIVLDLRSGGQVKMRKPRRLVGDSWESIGTTEFLAQLRANVKKGSVPRAVPHPAPNGSGSPAAPVAAPINPKGLVGEYVSTFKRFAEFQGRSGRREYWVFTLMTGTVSILLTIAWSVSLSVGLAASFNAAMVDGTGDVGGGGGASTGMILFLLVGFTLVVFVPALAVSVRRLHDTGRSGFFWLLGLIPLVGIVLIYFMLQPSDPGDNLYGPAPI